MRGLSGLFLVALLTVTSTVPAEAQAEPAPEVNDVNGVNDGYLPWRAQLEAERPPREPEPERPWYGWQTLGVDLMSIGMFVAGAFAEAPLVLVTSLGVWLLGSPFVHVAHDSAGAAAISFGIRATTELAMVGGFVLFLSEVFDESDSGGGVGVEVGAALFLVGAAGMIAAMAIDATLLAFGKPVAAKQSEFAIVPWVAPERGQVGLRCALAF